MPPNLPASTKKGGKSVAVGNVCKVLVPGGPPVPVPFGSTTDCAIALGTSVKVMCGNLPMLVAGSSMPTSMGDEPGTGGGIISGMIKGPVAPKTYSNKVIIEGKGAVFHTAVMAHNGTNANQPAGQQVAPSQTKVLVSP